MIINRLIPYISAFLVLLIFQIMLINPVFVLPGSILLLAITFLLAWQVNNRNLRNKNFWHFVIMLILSVISGVALLLFLESLLIKEILIFGVTILNFILLKNVFSFLHETEKYQPYSLENIYLYNNLICAFFLYTSFFSLIIYFNLSVWFLVMAAFFVSLLMSYLIFWANKISFKDSKILIIVCALIITEFFLAVSFLPTSYFVNGFILTAVFYFIINVSRDYIKKIFNTNRLRMHLAISFALILLILISARWA